MGAHAAVAVFEHLGEWVAGLRLDTVPEAGREVARRAITDYVGVTLAARSGDVADVLDQYRGGHPNAGEQATVIGRGVSAPAETAAFANAALGHALDFDDSNESLAGHPTMVVFPAALAAAEIAAATPAQVVEGYAAGFEVVAKMGRAVNFTHYERGWHPTATLGAFGAAAAASRVLDLDARQVAVALSIAASVSSGIKANFGSMAKPIQAGRAAQNGLFAARLAKFGATANPAAFEADQGYAAVFQGIETVDLDRLLAPVDEPWDLLDTGLNVKRFPCCASTHGAIEAAIAVHNDIGPDAAIEHVRVWTHPRRLKHTNRPSVATPFEGKFSVQYTVAAALQQGAIGLNDFTDEAIARPSVGQLMQRLIAQPMPSERWADHHYASEVEVDLADGTTVRHRIEMPSGVGPTDPLSIDDLHAKFRDCAQAGQVDDEHAEQLLQVVASLDHAEDLAHVTRLLAC